MPGTSPLVVGEWGRAWGDGQEKVTCRVQANCWGQWLFTHCNRSGSAVYAFLVPIAMEIPALEMGADIGIL